MTQLEHILKHLESKPLTPLEALALYGCYRLSARIKNLRDAGYNILTTIIKNNGKYFASYSMGDL